MKSMRPWRYAFSMAQRHDPSGATVAKAHFLHPAFGRRQKVVPDFGEYAAYFVDLALGEGSAGVAVDAALTLARL